MATPPSADIRRRSARAARDEVLKMLKDDHRRVKKSFRDFARLDAAAAPEQAQALVEHTCAELEVHGALEEELIYPAARAALRDTAPVDSAEVEHVLLKTLIDQLQASTPRDARYAATFRVLGEHVARHVKQEEGEILARLARGRIDWDRLSDALHARRDALLEEFLPEEAPSQLEGAHEHMLNAAPDLSPAARPGFAEAHRTPV